MKTIPGLKEPKQFFALWKDAKGKWHQFDTNSEDVAFKKAVLNDGEVYVDTRYKAKLRLYWYLVRKALYPPLQPFEIEMIKKTFTRCYGLRDAIIADTRGIMDTLAQQTGLNVHYLHKHLTQIKAL